MKYLLLLGLLAISKVNFSYAGTIDNFSNPIQVEATNQLFNALKWIEVPEELEGGEPEPCVPGGEYDSDCDGIEGTAGIDYPVYPYDTTQLTFTFKCSEQKYPGFYADPKYSCQIYHICADGQHWIGICNNGTIFDQSNRNCVHYKNFDCKTAVSLYDVNVDSFKPPVCLPMNEEAKDAQAVSLDQHAIQSPAVQFQKIHAQPEVALIAPTKDHAPVYDSYLPNGYPK